MPNFRGKPFVAFALLALLALVAGCAKPMAPASAPTPAPPPPPAPATQADEIEAPQAPEFPADAIWIGTEKPPTMQSLLGHVVLVDFWDYTCINCIRTFPHLKQWYARYHGDGLEIIGVHKGEFDFAQNEQNIRRAVARFGLPYPVIADVSDEVWNR